jgi:hypothetical protein
MSFGDSSIRRRSVLTGLTILATPASSKTFNVDPECKGMTDWHFAVGKVRLKIPVSYRPRMEQEVLLPPGFWDRVLFGHHHTYNADNSSVNVCQRQSSSWLDVDWIAIAQEGLNEFRKEAGLTPEQDGVSFIILAPKIASPGWAHWRWREGSVPGFLSDVRSEKPTQTGAFLLSKEKLFRGAQAWGAQVRQPSRLIFPTRFYFETSDALSVTVDSKGFSRQGIDGLKTDLAMVDKFIERILVS